MLPAGWLLAALPAFAGLRTGGELAILTHAQDIRNLSFKEAQRSYPVHLRAVVTFVDPGPGEVFVQDETAGIFVFEHGLVSDARVRVGQFVDITGSTTPADFAPAVTEAHLKVLGAGTLPAPKRRPFPELVDGKEDGQWFEIEGVARSGQMKGGRLFLNIATWGGSFVALLPEFPSNWSRVYVDARLVIRGVVAAEFNQNRQSVGVRMFVPGPAFIEIRQTAPEDVFVSPVSSAVSVGQFHPLQELPRRVRVRATVTAVEPGRAMFLADASGNLEVQPIPGCAAQPGDVVDVVGFPGVIEDRLGLTNSLCRLLAHGSPAPVLPIQAKEIIPPQVKTDPTGYGVAAGTRYDCRLVRLEGDLLETSSNPEGATLLLKSAAQDFLATLPVLAGQRLPQMETGSRLRLGVRRRS